MTTKGSILVIDDEPSHARLAGFALMEEGFDVITAASGSEGIEKATQEKVDLIILDIKMPDMDGLAVLHYLKTLPEITNLPIILFTGLFSQVDKRLARTSGAVDLIAKPADPSEIVGRVKNLLIPESEKVPEMAMC